MTNSEISKTFTLLSRLMEVHGENSFKSKSYANAAFNIDKLSFQLSASDRDKIKSVSGLGDSTTRKIIELLDTGNMHTLSELLQKTPPGILELLKIKGIGPKKINTIWKEMEIESVGELLYACKENRLKLFKGFGEKTQNNIADSLEFFLANQGNYLYAGVATLANELNEFFENKFGRGKVFITGDFKMQRPIIAQIEFVIESTEEEIKKVLHDQEIIQFKDKNEAILIYQTISNFPVIVYPSTHNTLVQKIITTSSSPEFTEALIKAGSVSMAANEKSYFAAIGLPFIPAYAREFANTIPDIDDDVIKSIVTRESVKGLVHCHSTWSDGNNTIAEMAEAAIVQGLEYMLITDHSKSAFYADGLFPEKVLAQQKEIDLLNNKFAPFKIFKGIESDILNDGSLDYEPGILSSFDCIIASIHSNLKMDEEKAMMRLLRAVENPYTSILGHMTGRLMLSRSGYPIDHKKIIDACAANNVAIELNANPNRLDMDWTMISYALKKNVLISINPDAHSIKGINDITYGVAVAQKGLLPLIKNVSSYTLAEFEKFVTIQRTKRSL